jgi:hypothetical protein
VEHENPFALLPLNRFDEVYQKGFGQIACEVWSRTVVGR